MKKSRFTDNQIIAVLKQAEGGIPVPKLCREHDINSAASYKWHSKFGGMEANMAARMKECNDPTLDLIAHYLAHRTLRRKVDLARKSLGHQMI